VRVGELAHGALRVEDELSSDVEEDGAAAELW
jgi:hypothetical protein